MCEWITTLDIHTYEIYFVKDWEDYAINLSVTDRAGNKSEWKDREYFTIDKTLPEVSIAIENNTDYEKENQLLYFNTDNRGMLQKRKQKRCVHPVYTTDTLQELIRKIIGAVTHVFVQDASSGYGIFIENMLKNTERLF